MKHLIVGVLLSLGIAGCTSGSSPIGPTPAPGSTSTTYTLTGTVLDDAGAPIQGATVQIDQSRQTTTASSGKYAFTELPYEGRIHLVSAWKVPGYGLSQESFEDYPHRDVIVLDFTVPRAR